MPHTKSGKFYSGRVGSGQGIVAGASQAVGTQNGAAFEAEEAYRIVATRNVTAVGGTSPTVVTNLQESLDGGTTWYTVGSYPSRSTVGTDRMGFSVTPGALLRWQHVITGSASTVGMQDIEKA